MRRVFFGNFWPTLRSRTAAKRILIAIGPGDIDFFGAVKYTGRKCGTVFETRLFLFEYPFANPSAISTVPRCVYFKQFARGLVPAVETSCRFDLPENYFSIRQKFKACQNTELVVADNSHKLWVCASSRTSDEGEKVS